eukprot:10589754-Heterocapsa_arctica.AAC.1
MECPICLQQFEGQEQLRWHIQCHLPQPAPEFHLTFDAPHEEEEEEEARGRGKRRQKKGPPTSRMWDDQARHPELQPPSQS